MKVKLIGTLLVSSLFATSICLAEVPSQLAVDTSAFSNSTQQDNAAPSNDQDASAGPTLSENSANSGNLNDDMSADTATGDDDY